MTWYDTFNDFGIALSAVANYLQVIFSALTAGGSVYAVMRSRYKAQKVVEEHLEEALALRGRQLAKMEEDLDKVRSRADQYDPNVWLERFDREQKDGNEARAAEVLRAGVSRTTLVLYEAYLALARHHIALYLLHDEALQLLEAERLTRIACLLSPRDRSALALLDEIDAVIRMQRIQRVLFDPQADEISIVDPSAYGGKLGTQAEAVIQAFSQRAETHRDAGHYLFYEMLAHHGLRIALRELSEASPITCEVRFHWVMSLYFNGRNAEALREVEALLLIEDQVLGNEHPYTLCTIDLKVKILVGFGRNAEALREVEALLLIEDQVLGSEHQNTLMTRRERAQVLEELGRNAEALREVEALLPIQERLMGSKHPYTLSMRTLRALILGKLGRNTEALREVEVLLPIQELTCGSEHPDTLSTRFLRVLILVLLGRSAEALREVEVLLPIQERVRGSEHPKTIEVRKERDLLLSRKK